MDIRKTKVTITGSYEFDEEETILEVRSSDGGFPLAGGFTISREDAKDIETGQSRDAYLKLMISPFSSDFAIYADETAFADDPGTFNFSPESYFPEWTEDADGKRDHWLEFAHVNAKILEHEIYEQDNSHYRVRLGCCGYEFSALIPDILVFNTGEKLARGRIISGEFLQYIDFHDAD